MRRNWNSCSSRAAGHLARRDAVARVGPAVAEPRRRAPATAARRAHRDQHVTGSPIAASRAASKQRQRSRSARRPRRPASTTSAPVARSAASTPATSVGGAVEVVRRDDDAAARRAPRIRSGANPARASTSTNSAPAPARASRIRRALLLGAVELPPSQAARQVTIAGPRRPRAPPRRPGGPRVEAQLDQVGVRLGGVARRAACSSIVLPGDGDAELAVARSRNRPQKEKSLLSRWLRRLPGILCPAACRLADAPPQLTHTTTNRTTKVPRRLASAQAERGHHDWRGNA